MLPPFKGLVHIRIEPVLAVVAIGARQGNVVAQAQIQGQLVESTFQLSCTKKPYW